jgi:isopenicillin-N N-acyltransferase-like protein
MRLGDWQEEQQENLINLSIRQEHKPTIDMVTEAGIIGKIGLNSKGVGVCLNAIRALGVDFQRLPCHLALRTCLESSSVQEAVATLQESHVASACHILVADSREAIGLECSHMDIVELPTNEILTHTNHFVKSHPVEDKTAFVDSPVRLRRINELIHERGEELDGSKTLTTESIRILLEDTENSPTAICRSQTKDSTVATLFNIVMDLTKPSAEVMIGKPTQHGAEIMYLEPQTSSQTFGDYA